MSSNVLPKLTRADLVSTFESPRFDHPARKDFTLQGKTMRGRFYPNPEGCTGLRLRRYIRPIHVPMEALVN